MDKLSKVVDKVFKENRPIVKDAKNIDAARAYLVRLIIWATRNRVAYHVASRLVKEKLRRY